MNRKKEQIQERREFGKASLYRRGRADSVIRLGSNLFAGECFSACVSSSHLPYFIETPELKRHCFYKKSSGYFYFFPASGNRGYGDGKLYNSGVSGYGWTSTPNGSNAWNLDIWSTNAHMNSNNRGNGFPVRCVQASAPVFVFIKDTFCFFPATGYRHYSNGSFYNSGTWGYWWTSTPGDDGKAWRLHVESGSCQVVADWCSYGFPVRCVQASAAVWAVKKENIKQIRYRRESGKACLYRRGQADSVTRLGRKAEVNELFIFCLTPSHLFRLMEVPAINRLYFYKYSSGYFLFFPAAGYRNYNDGTLRDSGKEGDGWTSTPNGSNGWYLRFLSGIAHVNNNNRGNGFPVRCVQASATVFVLFFPAAGVRRYSDGVLYNGGVEGDGWTSTPVDSNNAYRFGFNAGVANMGGGTDRMYGFPVRCVQASAAVWAIQKKNVKQIRYRREFGKACLYRRGQADSVTRLGRKAEVNDLFIFCLTPSHLFRLIEVPAINRLYFYKHSSGYFLFFPAAGIRNYSDGSLRNSGGEGDGWTSTPYNSDNAYRFILNSGNANMSNTNRTYGFPVRCVQGSAAVFAFTNDTFVFFPATGHRSSSVGSVYYSGSRGYVWTSVPYDSNRAYYLVFYSGGTYVESDGRIAGRSVRCVQASAAVFVFANDTFVFFPVSGYRHSNGASGGSGSDGRAWTSTLSAGGAYDFGGWNSEIHMSVHPRDYGFPVRCVQDSAIVFVFANDTFVFFPASGVRRNSDGVLYYSGVEGDGWTSTPYNSDNAYRFILNSGNAYMGGEAARTYGFPVRCVQASAAVFACIKDTFCFFPASGNRNPSSGNLGNSGLSGYGWTSVPNGSNAWYLDVFPSNARVLDNVSGGFGFPVRCVQASATVWVLQKENIKQIRYRRESGKASLCRRGQADSVTRLGRKLSIRHSFLPCAALSYVFTLIKLPVFKSLYFYKYSSGYFLFFPASGYRHFSDGKLGGSGSLGYGWTSTPGGTGNAWYLDFFGSYVRVNNYDRGHGFAVRCVQASAAVFVFANDTFVFFPASGIRSRGDGNIADLGVRGLLWTVTPEDSRSALVSVGPGKVSVYSDDCKYGLAVRCVQASALVFAFIKDTFVFFPASGYRSPDAGQLGGSGTEGDGWTSSVVDSEIVYHLRFLSGTTHVNGNHRPTGFPVRCVQASATVWIYLEKGLEQIRFRRESGKASLCRRGQADSVTRLGRKVFASENYFVCAASSYLFWFIKLPVFQSLYFYKHSSGYFLFFPATGYHMYNSGKVSESGGYGGGWSSTPNGGNAWNLSFRSGGAAVDYNIRTFGRSVRCVQASAAVFVFTKETFVFFPASGHRNADTAQLTVAGARGDIWSSTTYGSTAWYLYFSSANAYMSNYERVGARSVRCVQASAIVFVCMVLLIKNKCYGK